MDLEALAAKLELAESFRDRQKLATGIAKSATPDDLGKVTRLLGHGVEGVRLGAIAILTVTRFRPALKHLAAVTVQKSGEERVFAARAIAHLAEPGDKDLLLPMARTWLETDDSFLHSHAEDVFKKLGVPVEKPSPPAAGAGEVAIPGYGITAADSSKRKKAIARTLASDNSERIFIDALSERQPPGVRLDLVTGLERLGSERFAAAAIPLLRKPEGEVVTLLARALARHLGNLSGKPLADVRDALDYAHRNLSSHEMARAAIDDCLRP